MSINPITSTKNIRAEYTKYLKSMFLFKDNKLRTAANKAIDISKTELIKGPYLESTATYEKGATLHEMVARGDLHKGFERLIPEIGEYNLHKHQEKAIYKASVEKKNIIISTGTGSGKTEGFLVPILNYLVEEKEAGSLGPGVRALLLYPMNALANDQLKRLRGILKEYPEITFGRYTGETKQTKSEAIDYFKKINTDPEDKMLPNELLSRDEMRDTPPNILLTNYAMLEYLLLRPDDNAFFDGLYSQSWKYIVLDEAHVYSGSLGSEISYLLARLKDRVVNGEKGKLQFIATSATLGGGETEIVDVIQYANDLFGEDFSADCLITSTRVKTRSNSSLIKPDISWYSEFLDLTEQYSGSELVEKINERNIYNKLEIKEHNEEIIYDALIQDYYINKLKTVIEERTLLIYQVVEEVFGKQGKANENFLALVDLAAKAKKEDNPETLLPTRYHTFAKAIEGAFVRFYPEKEMYLNRKEYDYIGNEQVQVFELANCIKCGQEYIFGKIENGYLRQSSGFSKKDKLEYFMINDSFSSVEVDEDSVIEEESDSDIQVNDAEEYLLCIKCGKVQANNRRADRDCCNYSKHIKVYRVEHKGSLNTCLSCGSYSRDVVRKLVNADAPTTEMLARTLYQNIPPEEAENMKIDDTGTQFEDSLFGNVGLFNIKEDTVMDEENGRKLLAFSDSRKEAAHFASFMDIRYNNYLWRKIIIDAIEELQKENRLINYGSLFNRIYKNVEHQKYSLKYENDEIIEETIAAYIMYELMAYEPENGLEGVGLISIEIEKPNWWKNIKLFDLTSDETWDIVMQIFNGLRKRRAVKLPDDLRPNHPLFGQRRNTMSFRNAGANSKLGIMSINPKEKFNNMRFEYLTKIFKKRGDDIEEAKKKAKEFLDKIFGDSNFVNGLLNDDIYTYFTIRNEGRVYQLNYNKWNIYTDKTVFRCEKCGEKTTININGVCPKYRCDGELHEYNNETDRDKYYIDIYNNIKKIPMNIKEHTAQLSTIHASEVQNKFEKGEVNILSCSTTFEMGVDVGSLEAVFLRNIPPETSNYVQRAGRAGRRTESTAYILTYAKRRSHDLYYFQSPDKIIEGQIKVPYIEKNNDKIAFRHLCSVVFSWVFRQNVDYFSDVQSLFAYNKEYSSVDEYLREALKEQPESLKESFKNIFNKSLQKLFEIENWGWVDNKLLNENQNLIVSKNKWLSDVEEINNIKLEYIRNDKSTGSIIKILETYLKRSVIDFLASNNVLPRYGFPVDTVDLSTIHAGEAARNVNLSRDLKMAISEFAPENKVIANGYLFTSYAINIVRNKGWPTYLYGICKDCNAIYKEPCDYDLKFSDIDEDKRYCKKENCNAPLELHKFIKPIFGFSTNNSKPEKPTLTPPQTNFSSRVYFHQYDENERNFEDTIKINNYDINYTYSPRGNLFIVNYGKTGGGFRLCVRCGYGTQDISKKKVLHKDKFGNPCPNEYLSRFDLGHEIISDIVEIDIPNISGYYSERTYFSVLYAIIEGAVGYLGIDRREIDGTLNFSSETGYPTFILYDQVPGGVGHVKRIGKNLDKVINEAKNRVSGLCGCGEETSCYGCLRNYSNQIHHDILERGRALMVFKALEGEDDALLDIAATEERIF